MALFAAGNKAAVGHGGRNHKNRQKVLEIFAQYDYHPIEEMVKDAQLIKCRIFALLSLEEELRNKDEQEKIKPLIESLYRWLELKNAKDKELAQYQAPKLKAVEHKFDENKPLLFQVNMSGTADARSDNVQRDENGSELSS